MSCERFKGQDHFVFTEASEPIVGAQCVFCGGLGLLGFHGGSGQEKNLPSMQETLFRSLG